MLFRLQRYESFLVWQNIISFMAENERRERHLTGRAIEQGMLQNGAPLAVFVAGSACGTRDYSSSAAAKHHWCFAHRRP